MVCPLASWSVGGRLVVGPATSLALRVASQFHCVVSGKGLKFIFLDCESFALFGLVSGTRLNFLAATFGLGWKDLLMKGVVIICLHLINSAIFFFNDGKSWILAPLGLYLMTYVLLSFL